MSDIPLPTLHEARLDLAGLDALLNDIGALGTVVEIQIKGAAATRAATAPSDLAAVRAALSTGEVRGVQLRYRHRGIEWWDTLMRDAQGIKLVRMQAPRG